MRTSTIVHTRTVAAPVDERLASRSSQAVHTVALEGRAMVVTGAPRHTGVRVTRVDAILTVGAGEANITLTLVVIYSINAMSIV